MSNVHIRITKVNAVDTTKQSISTDLGEISYDYLVLGLGTDTNFFGMQNMIDKAIPMKSVSEAIYLRNRVLQNLEDALTTGDPLEREGLMNIRLKC